MPKPKYIISLAGGRDRKNPVTSGPAAVYSDADLKKRLRAAKDAGVKVNVRPAED